MKTGADNPTKQLYNELRLLSCEQLWRVEVSRFNAATPEQRMERVGLVRAVSLERLPKGLFATGWILFRKVTSAERCGRWPTGRMRCVRKY